MAITQKDIRAYFKKHKTSTYQDFSKEFGISSVWARQVLRGKVSSSLNFNGRYITLIEGKKFDKYGIIKIDKIIFSKHGSIRATILYLVKTYDKINSGSIYSILGINPGQQLTILLRKNQIFARKQGRTYLYSIEPFKTEIVKEKEFDISSLKEGDKILRDLEIIKETKENKKTEVAKKYDISIDTVRNIEERFNRDGVKGLIHTRKSKTINISSAKEAAIVTELATNPEKTSKEIKKSLNELKSVSLKAINETIKKVKPLIEPKKKILMEIQ